MSLPRIRLGRSDLEVAQLAFGLMSLSQTYGPSEDAASLETIHAAIDEGLDLLDTAEIYGVGHNERLFGEVLQSRRHEVVVSTKFGLELADGGMRANGRPDNARRAIEGSLERLGIDTVDLYYLHRVDPDVPIEETVGAMGRLVEEGKVRTIGLSEANAETLRRAHAEFPVTALQSEYSVFHRLPEDEILETCRELGTTFVAFSPLGRGLLTGTVRAAAELDERDMRRHSPQLADENVAANLVVIDAFVDLAREREVDPSRLALAWALAQDVVPLFGTRRAARVRSNARAAEIRVDPTLRERIDEIAPRGAIQGAALRPSMEALKQR